MWSLRRALESSLGNLFELEDLGPQELKGVAGSVRAWVALDPLQSRAASTLSTQPDSPSSLGGKKNSTYCFDGGRKRRLAKAKSCCSRVNRASASRG